MNTITHYLSEEPRKASEPKFAVDLEDTPVWALPRKLEEPRAVTAVTKIDMKAPMEWTE